jgi:23S rRNA U2552 (ribose-2'-O)-methylase RlmE/FtsJ
MQQNKIPLEEVEFHRLSFADPNGRLFWWNDELYRGISPERKDFYTKLFTGGAIDNLLKRGLVETEVTPFSMDDYPLILKHRVVPFVSYVYEWPSLMLKDAALALIDIAIELAQEGLALHDAHPWNILFHGSKPFFVDFSSIVPSPASSGWRAHNEFQRFFLYPLRLMSHGHSRVARLLLRDYEAGISQSECDALVHDPFTHLAKQLKPVIGAHVPPQIRPGVKKVVTALRSVRRSFSTSRGSLSRSEYFKAIRRQVENIRIDSQQSSWSNYYDNDFFPSFEPSSAWTAKHQAVYNILSQIKPDSVLDIGSNRGWYAQLAASIGVNNVVAFDADETAVNRLYCDVKNQGKVILPLVMDIRRPSPETQIEMSAGDRLKCDLVLALALVHHLVFKNFLRFDKIVSAFLPFTKRSLVVEFIPKEDQFVSQWWSPSYSWYTLENLIAELRRHFRSVSVHASYPKPRVLLVCER